jgi:colicin import membrane protein
MAVEESSVLFSLNELRSIEQDRVAEEREWERARREAERNAREQAEQRAREDVARRRLEREQALRREESERARAEADERIRLREEELRVQAELEARREAVRVEAEARARLALERRFPVGGVVAATLLAVGTVVVGMMLYMQKSGAEVTAHERAIETRIAEEQRARERDHAAELMRYRAQLELLRARLERVRAAEEPAPPPASPADRRRGRGHSPRSSAPTHPGNQSIPAGALKDPAFGMD